MNIQKAIALANEAHWLQKDKAGVHYILHPLRVMLNFEDDNERMAAVLHDVVEDTSVTLDDLRHQGFPPEVIEAVDALSRRDGETYMEFVARAKANKIAKRIKVADIIDNMSRITPELKGLEHRYIKALTFLQEP